MKLYDIIKDVAKTSLPDMEISDVTSDTRKAVKPQISFADYNCTALFYHVLSSVMSVKGLSFYAHEHRACLDSLSCVSNICSDLGRLTVRNHDKE